MEKENQEFSLEKQLTRLRSLLDQMQKGVGDFDRQMALFKEGQTIVQSARRYLDEAELQVKQLVEGEEVPFGKS